jgi:type IV pilus assembly protein PilV
MKKQQGIGLVEVMVAAVITAIGILGYAGMQIQTLSETANAQHRMQALAIVGDLVSRVRANTPPNSLVPPAVRDIYINANYHPDQYSAHATRCHGNVCTPEQLANADLNALRQQLATLLPSATMTLSPNEDNATYVVRVAWSGQPATDAQCDAPQFSEDNQYESRCVVLEVEI